MGYMGVLCKVLASLPADVEQHIKTTVGIDPGQPCGQNGDARGLVRDLVEMCLFALPQYPGGGDKGGADEVKHVPSPSDPGMQCARVS